MRKAQGHEHQLRLIEETREEMASLLMNLASQVHHQALLRTRVSRMQEPTTFMQKSTPALGLGCGTTLGAAWAP